MDKLEKAKGLAALLEQQHDGEREAARALDAACEPWDSTISALKEQIAALSLARDTNPAVGVMSRLHQEAVQSLLEAQGRLIHLAVELVDAEAYYPSGTKSQVLTNRITLKSQMPKLPSVVDDMALVEALVADGRLGEFAKSVSIKLDNDVAEAIMRWWLSREDGDIGLEAPQPKVLNIKVKPKEE